MARREEQLLDPTQHNTVLFRTTPAIAREMAESGAALHICLHCSTDDFSKKTCQGRVQAHVPVYVLSPTFRNIFLSNPTITFANMLALMGLHRRDERNHSVSAAYQRFIAKKVELFDPKEWRKHLIKCAEVQAQCPA